MGQSIKVIKKEKTNNMTAVEWLIDQIESKGDAWENASIRRLQISIDVSDYLDLKRQAKEMEKEQIVEANINGQAKPHFSLESRMTEAEKYYNDTYGSNTEI
jgi:hypothetical protein